MERESKFNGISPEMILLLAENRFNNSKSFYDEHKDIIKHNITMPLYDLINDLYPQLYAVDSEMCLIPSRMISRIRRDTRFSNDKSLYRENVWIMFMRNKHDWQYRQPCMWFEFTPECLTYGVGTFNCDPTFMSHFRKRLDEHADEFIKAVRKIKKLGITPDLKSYKKDRSLGKKPELKPFYNAKEIYFISQKKPLDKLFDGSIEQELSQAITAFKPMYRFLLSVMEDCLSNAE